MGELSLFRKGLFVALVVVGGGLFVSSCNKEELISDRTDQKDCQYSCHLEKGEFFQLLNHDVLVSPDQKRICSRPFLLK